MKPVNTIQMNSIAPVATVRCHARFNSVLVARPDSNMDVRFPEFTLMPEAPKTEIITRAITTGGNIVSRGYIEGNEPEVKGHLECRGLILGAKGTIHAIPELKGNLAGIDLYHEAARRQNRRRRSRIFNGTRHPPGKKPLRRLSGGFLRVDIDGLPPMLNDELQRAVKPDEKDFM